MICPVLEDACSFFSAEGQLQGYNVGLLSALAEHLIVPRHHHKAPYDQDQCHQADRYQDLERDTIDESNESRGACRTAVMCGVVCHGP